MLTEKQVLLSVGLTLLSCFPAVSVAVSPNPAPASEPWACRHCSAFPLRPLLSPSPPGPASDLWSIILQKYMWKAVLYFETSLLTEFLCSVGEMAGREGSRSGMTQIPLSTWIIWETCQPTHLSLEELTQCPWSCLQPPSRALDHGCAKKANLCSLGEVFTSPFYQSFFTSPLDRTRSVQVFSNSDKGVCLQFLLQFLNVKKTMVESSMKPGLWGQQKILCKTFLKIIFIFSIVVGLRLFFPLLKFRFTYFVHHNSWFLKHFHLWFVTVLLYSLVDK